MGAGCTKLYLATHLLTPLPFPAACPAGEAESTFVKTRTIPANQCTNRDTNYSNSQDHQLRSQCMHSR